MSKDRLLEISLSVARTALIEFAELKGYFQVVQKHRLLLSHLNTAKMLVTKANWETSISRNDTDILTKLHKLLSEVIVALEDPACSRTIIQYYKTYVHEWLDHFENKW